MEPCGNYSIFDSLGFRSFITDASQLIFVTKIAFEPIKSYSSDAVTV